MFKEGPYARNRQFVLQLDCGVPVLAVQNDVGGYEAQMRMHILAVEFYLASLGATSGQTTIDLKVNGTSILAAAVSIAYNAATKRARVIPAGSAANPLAGEPNGVVINPGDYIRADVTAIPGTASQGLAVYLLCVMQDV